MHCSLPSLTRRLAVVTVLLVAALLLLPAVSVAQKSQIDNKITSTMWVMQPEDSGFIEDLNQLPPFQGSGLDLEELSHPVYRPVINQGQPQHDRAVQHSIGPLVAGTSSLSVDGLGYGVSGFTVSGVPPDPNLAVGTTQYVQTVNSGFAVYNKSTGAIVSGYPKNLYALWSSLSATGCKTSTYSFTDPVVSFDQFAQRWLLTTLVIHNTTFYHCIAVSTTADATGSWTVLQYNVGSKIGHSTYLPDYPKQGVWRDAYTFTYDMFNSAGTTYYGATVCGMDRNAILGGNTQSDYDMLPDLGK